MTFIHNTGRDRNACTGIIKTSVSSKLGYSVSEIVDRDYGQTEFFVTDDDGYSHCFGAATNKNG
jgi:hypothetical protein